MDKKNIKEEVMKIITDMPGHATCTAEMDLMDEIGFSSIEFMEFIAYVEDIFEVHISSRDLSRISTPEELVEYIEEKLR